MYALLEPPSSPAIAAIRMMSASDQAAKKTVATAEDSLQWQRPQQRHAQHAQSYRRQDQYPVRAIPPADGVEGGPQADDGREPDADLDRGESALNFLLGNVAGSRRRPSPPRAGRCLRDRSDSFPKRRCPVIRTSGEILRDHHMYDQHDVETLERQFNGAMEEADTGSSLEAVRRIYDEIGRGGAGLEALLHPDFQIRMETVFLDGKTYKGVRGFKNWRGDMEAPPRSDSFRPEGLRSAADGRWVVLGQAPDHREGERRRLDVPLAHVLEQRDRKVASFTAYSEISAALESVGLPV